MSYIQKTLGRGENVILTSRRHIVVLISYAIKYIGLFLVALLAAVWLAANWQTSSDPNLNTLKTVIVLALFALALFAFIGMLANYIRWYNEEYIITNQRVIRIEGILNKDELDSSLSMVNDIDVHQSLWGRLLNYGTVEILTASEDGANRLAFMPNPIQFRKAILDAKSGYYNQANTAAPGVSPGSQPQPGGVIDRTGGYERGYPYNQNGYDQASSGYQNQPAYPTQRLDGSYQVSNGYQPPLPSNNGAASYGQIRPQDIPAMIQQLAKLRDGGVMTEAEFQAKKNDLLSRM